MRKLIAFLFRYFFQIKYFRHTYFGFYKRIFKPLNLFKDVTTKILYRNKIFLYLNLEDWIQQNLFFTCEYEEKEIRYLEKALKEGDTFIDVGANIGLFSCIASMQVGDKGFVYSFEPMKKTYDSLLENIKLNHFKNIRTENIAVSDKKQTLKIHLNDSEKNSGMASAYSKNSTYTEDVQATSLDEYFLDKKINSIKLIKIDIEGGEYLALLGMINLLKKFKPILLVEINPDNPFGKEKIENLLNEIGYKTYFINDEGVSIYEKLPYDVSNNYLFI